MSVLLLIGAFPFVLLAVVILVGALDRGIPKRRLAETAARPRGHASTDVEQWAAIRTSNRIGAPLAAVRLDPATTESASELWCLRRGLVRWTCRQPTSAREVSRSNRQAVHRAPPRRLHVEGNAILNAGSPDAAEPDPSVPPVHLVPHPEPKAESPLTPRPDAIDSPSPGLLDELGDLPQSHDEPG